MADLNVCAGIDAGSYESKTAYTDELSTRIIARLDGFDLRALREEIEAYFDEPVFSCVAAYDSRVKTEGTGFTDVNWLTQGEAVCLGLGSEGRHVVYDLGESACRMYAVDGGEVIEKVTVDDVCGRVITRNFAEYLCDRYGFDMKGGNVEHESRRIKHTLSVEDFAVWHELKIYRYEFERLIHFPVKRTGRILQRLVKVYRPDGVILTGGSIKIPEVRRVLSELTGITTEYRENLIAEGAAARARELQKGSRHSENWNTAGRLRELRAGMIELEEKLTRQQKDRVYALFRQAEGMNDEGIITLMEGLIRELRSV